MHSSQQCNELNNHCKEYPLVKNIFSVDGYEFDITMTTQMLADYGVEECCEFQIKC